LQLPEEVDAGIWWYASFPNHYSGDSAGANAERGSVLMDQRIAHYVDTIRAIKADEAALRLLREFFEQAAHPVDTKP
jgi:creatinine amidohydrolase